MNSASQPLQPHEITAMKADTVIMGRIMQSYRMMLEFYGMKLDSPDTGLLSRVTPETKNADRYRNLVRKSPQEGNEGIDSISISVFSLDGR